MDRWLLSLIRLLFVILTPDDQALVGVTLCRTCLLDLGKAGRAPRPGLFLEGQQVSAAGLGASAARPFWVPPQAWKYWACHWRSWCSDESEALSSWGPRCAKGWAIRWRRRGWESSSLALRYPAPRRGHALPYSVFPALGVRSKQCSSSLRYPVEEQMTDGNLDFLWGSFWNVQKCGITRSCYP